MTIARKETVPQNAEGVFHCVSRCVRRGFLCGKDPYSGRSFEHRREWIRTRLENLAAWFAIEVCGYAVMSNHVHLVLRTRPDWVRDWDDREVAERWLSIYPQKENTPKSGKKESLPPGRSLIRDRRKLKEIRQRLSSFGTQIPCQERFHTLRSTQTYPFKSISSGKLLEALPLTKFPSFLKQFLSRLAFLQNFRCPIN